MTPIGSICWCTAESSPGCLPKISLFAQVFQAAGILIKLAVEKVLLAYLLDNVWFQFRDARPTYALWHSGDVERAR